jgi:sulfoquinovosidase
MLRVLACCLPFLLAGAAPAAADVAIGEREVVVSGPGGRAVVERDPLRVRFEDPAGRTVLRQVAGPGPRPHAAVDPEPGGGDAVREPSLYGPFVFTVGIDQPVQHPPGSPAHYGNMLTGAQAGVQHHATRVVEAAAADGGAARLVLATTDPLRTLTVTIRPDGGTLRVAARPSPAAGVATMGDAFVAPDGEAFRGFGGRANALDQRGEDLYNWLEEENYEPGPFSPLFQALPGFGGDRYQFPNGPHAAYYPQPLFVSSERYGFLLDRTELSRFRLAHDRDDAWQAGVAAPALDYAVAPGDAKTAIGALTAQTGRQPAPAAWALRPSTSVNWTASTLTDPGAYEREVRATLAEIERHDLRFGAFGIEGWDGQPEAKLRELMAEVERLGMKPMAYFTPFIQAGPDAERYGVKTAAGTPYLYPSVFGVLTLVDFTNPDAVAWWQRRVRRALELGFEGFMQDWGEQVQLDMHFHDGRTGVELHNAYPRLYHRATREVVRAFEAENRPRRILFFTRSGFAGSAGFEGGNFPGDEHASWSRAKGIGSLAPDMLNRGIGGAPGFSTDVGGYLDTWGSLTEELWTRWVQWAALSPLFRFHNSVGQGTRQPWHFPTGLTTYRRYERLRARAEPLIARLWREAERTGVPIARPLWLEAPGDPAAAREEQQWLLGRDVLVAPVVQQGATARDVVFPDGCWRHGDTGERFDGPATRRVGAPIDSLPWFVRCGTDPLEDR